MKADGPHCVLATGGGVTDFLPTFKGVVEPAGSVPIEAAGPHVHLALSGGENSSGGGALAQVAKTSNQAAQPFKMLLSYHYYKTQPIDKIVNHFNQRPMVFADSGAFSAGMQGVTIDIVDYVRWVRQWRPLLSTYVNLDVVHYNARNPEGDALATWANQRRLEDEFGLSPVPVFHGGEPWRYLERYLERGYPYVALGGMVGGPDAIMRWLIQCFKMAAKADTVFHGFGQTTGKYVENFPWYSVDSSSWGSGHRYGNVSLWDDKRHKFVRVGVGNRKEVYAKAALVRSHGVNPADLADRSRYHRRFAIHASVVAWRRYESWLRRHHGPVPFPDRPHPAEPGGGQARREGPHVFLAEGAGGNLAACAPAVNGPHVYLAETEKINVKLAGDAVAEEESK